MKISAKPFLQAFVFLALALWSGAVLAAERIALVIGNGAYEHEAHLPNPPRDAVGVAKALRGLGFEVEEVLDQNYDQMRRAFRAFGVKSRSAEIALIYYAGHGIEIDGENYLIPVDASLADDESVDLELLRLVQATGAVRGASALGLVILDSCRDNPFAARMQRTRGVTRSVGRGLARSAVTEKNILVAYAASEGQVAEDGARGGHSPYAGALIAALEGEPLSIERLLGDVRDRVWDATRGKQIPHFYGTMGREAVSLHPPKQEAAPPNPCETRERPGYRCELQDGFAVFVQIAPEPPPEPVSAPPPAPEAGSRSVGGAASFSPASGSLAAGELERARAGSAEDMFAIGFSYANGRNGAPKSDVEAAVWYRRGAEAGNAKAMYNLGWMHAQGRGVAQNDAEAANWYLKGAEAGVPAAMNAIAGRYASGLGVAKNLEAARRWHNQALASGEPEAREKARHALERLEAAAAELLPEAGSFAFGYLERARTGSPEDMFNLGFSYRTGRNGAPQSDLEALRWYLQAAEAGEARAMHHLVGIYESGRGVERSAAKALQWLRRAAEASNPSAMLELATLHEMGRGVARDHNEARRWLGYALALGGDEQREKARKDLERLGGTLPAPPRKGSVAEGELRRAGSGDAASMFAIAVSYATGGDGAPQSDVEAVHWYLRSAAAGNRGAMNNLAWMHRSGRGAPPNDAEAVRWYRRAAEAGEVMAMTSLGWMYENGRGVDVDYAEARRLYVQAAAEDNAIAMNNLGEMHEYGRGGESDLGEARRWYSLALNSESAAQRDRARESLKRLDEN